MAFGEPVREPLRRRMPVNIDFVLGAATDPKTVPACAIGQGTGRASESGFFRNDSGLIAVLGADNADGLGSPGTATLIFNRGGSFTVAETGYQVLFSKDTPIDRDTVGGGQNVSQQHAKLTYDKMKRQNIYVDTRSKNGAVFLKPDTVVPDGQFHESSSPAVVVENVFDHRHIEVKVGKTDIELDRLRMTGFAFSGKTAPDASANRTDNTILFRSSSTKEAGVTVGGKGKIHGALERLRGPVVSVDDPDLTPDQLRFILSGDHLYILNMAGSRGVRRKFSVRVGESLD